MENLTLKDFENFAEELEGVYLMNYFLFNCYISIASGIVQKFTDYITDKIDTPTLRKKDAENLTALYAKVQLLEKKYGFTDVCFNGNVEFMKMFKEVCDIINRVFE